MRVLVTGADGFIGGEIARRLRGTGAEVLGGVYEREPRSGEVRIDLSRPREIELLPRVHFDAVVHAAGIVDQAAPRRAVMAVNAAGTCRLAAWASSLGCPHFLYLSSVSVYGVRTMGQNRREGTRRCGPLLSIPYMRSKVRAERCLEDGAGGYTTLRLPPVLGAGDTYLSPTIIGGLMHGRLQRLPAVQAPVPCAGQELADQRPAPGGSPAGPRVSLMTVRNLASVVEAVLQAGPLQGSFNCCDWHPRWPELVGQYARCLRRQEAAPARYSGAHVPVGGAGLRQAVAVPGLRNKGLLLLLGFSRFGAHFPDDALHARVPHRHEQRWQEAVAEAVAAFWRHAAGSAGSGSGS